MLLIYLLLSQFSAILSLVIWTEIARTRQEHYSRFGHRLGKLFSLLARPNLIPQNHVLPGNLRQSDESGIRPYLCRSLLLEVCRPWGDLGADRLYRGRGAGAKKAGKERPA